MNANSTTAEQDFDDFPFVLTESKLRRLLEVCMNHFLDEERGLVELSIVAEMKTGRQSTFADLGDLFNIDNPRKSGIGKLWISLRLPGESPSSGKRVRIRLGEGARISVAVASGSVHWTHSLLGAIEEQLERLRQPAWPHRVKKALGDLSLIMMFAGIALMVLCIVALEALSAKKKERMSAIFDDAQGAATLEEKVDGILQIQMLENGLGSSLSSGESLDIGSVEPYVYANVLIFVLAIGSVIYLVRFCYPPCVFAWGDVQEFYDSLVKRRRYIGNVVFGTIFLGILVNVASASLGL